MIESVEQNTPEWLEARKGFVGASDAPIIAGVNRYHDIQYLWREKLSLNPPEKMSYPAQRGKELEPVALDIFNHEFGVVAVPVMMVSKRMPFMSASLDGYLAETNSIVEIKCPMGKKPFLAAKDGLVKEDHYPQLQHQLFVAEADYVDYVTFNGETEIVVNRVFPNLEYQRKLVRLEKWFWAKVTARSEIKQYGVTLQMPDLSSRPGEVGNERGN